MQNYSNCLVTLGEHRYMEPTWKHFVGLTSRYEKLTKLCLLGN